MPMVCGDDTIAGYRKQWHGQEKLLEQLVLILKGNGKADDNAEILGRIKKANELLIANDMAPYETERRIDLRDCFASLAMT